MSLDSGDPKRFSYRLRSPGLKMQTGPCDCLLDHCPVWAPGNWPRHSCMHVEGKKGKTAPPSSPTLPTARSEREGKAEQSPMANMVITSSNKRHPSIALKKQTKTPLSIGKELGRKRETTKWRMPMTLAQRVGRALFSLVSIVSNFLMCLFFPMEDKTILFFPLLSSQHIDPGPINEVLNQNLIILHITWIQGFVPVPVHGLLGNRLHSRRWAREASSVFTDSPHHSHYCLSSASC